MKEQSLRSIINIFALVANYGNNANSHLFQSLVEIYLTSQFSNTTTELYTQKFIEELQRLDKLKVEHGSAWKMFHREETEAQCYILSRELSLADRILVLMYLIEFSPYLTGIRVDLNPGQESENQKLLLHLSTNLKIHQNYFCDCYAFVNDLFYEISDESKILIYSSNKDLQIKGCTLKYYSGINGQLIFLKIGNLNTTFFKVKGEAQFELSNHLLFKGRTYILPKGAIIQLDSKKSLYYNDIIKGFATVDIRKKLVLETTNLEFRYKNSSHGLKTLNFSAESGHMVAIMGGSGSGKTTLVNILIGLYRPNAGSVTINGVDIHKSPAQTKGFIGYVPQDDALIEQLTVFQNLYFSASLCLGDLNEEELIDRVHDTLKDLGLFDFKDLRVGSPLDKVISGGQRKRLNIALELIRDPGILFLDEPTSGLSSADSENIMKILKLTAEKGRLVIVNIHQPSSEIFKLFDKLLFVDQEGHPVYSGYPMKVLSYLKQNMNLVDSDQSECQTCGNLNPEEIFKLVQMRKLLSDGTKSDERAVPPAKWHKFLLKKQLQTFDEAQTLRGLPPSMLHLPNVFKQFYIFSTRNLYAKLTDYQYSLLSVFIAPILGMVLSVFCRYVDPTIGVYKYFENDNIPSFLLIGVLVALFIGLIASSEEIINDRKILRREQFLNLSKNSYLFSKITFLFALSAIQMFFYVAISNAVLGIHGMNFVFFLIFWSTACFANILGLLISSIFKTVAAVYISIPFLLIPQVLLVGTVIRYDKLNPMFISDKYVPLAGNVMVSHWTYEALAVELYKNNAFERTFYDLEKNISNAAYVQNFLIPEVQNYLYEPIDSLSEKKMKNRAELFANEINRINKLAQIKELPDLNIELSIENFLSSASTKVAAVYDSLMYIKDSRLEIMGDSTYTHLRELNYNKELADLVLDNNSHEKIRILETEMVRKFRPIYYYPENTHGFAHIYAPVKNIGGVYISTAYFNLAVIWLFTMAIFIVLMVRKVE